jgi:hypothetical protein
MTRDVALMSLVLLIALFGWAWMLAVLAGMQA